MKHFIYQTTSPSGKFYRGRHSTTNINDGYLGSGKWISSIKDKSQLRRDILIFANSFEELLILEEKYISEVIGTPNNMNYNNRSCGFASGDLNYSRTPEARKISSLRKKGVTFEQQFGTERAQEISNKISKSRTGRSFGPTWNKGLTKENSAILRDMSSKISATLVEINASLSSDERKEKYGNCGADNGFFNQKHSGETIAHLKKKQKDNRLNNRITCIHCGKNLDKANYTRYHGDKCKLKHDNLPSQHISTESGGQA
jgi:hypothetical protein